MNSDEQFNDIDAARRRDAALLRALSTPHKKQADMKVGKSKLRSGVIKSDYIEFVANDLLPGLLACAYASYPDGCTLVILQPGLLEREVVEFVAAAAGPASRKVCNELVRIDFNASSCGPLSQMLRSQLRKLIGPFLEGIGEIRIDDSPEGIVILALNGR
jgi:hypothetical protein